MTAIRRHRGFTLLELMIAIAIAIFLVGGLLVILQNVGRAQRNQTALAQLQDNQRMAMTLITDVVQSAGYFPDPTANTMASSLPATASPAMAVGQMIYGTFGAADPGDTLTVRFTTASGDGIVNCAGDTNTSVPAATIRYVNKFSVTADGKLVCSVNGANPARQIVDGLKKLEVWYGVKRSTAVDDFTVDTYLLADELTAADWTNISSVRVRLTFTNPLAGQAGQPATLRFTRTIAIMSRAGVKA